MTREACWRDIEAESFVDGRIEAALAQHDEIVREVHARIIAQERKKWRAECLLRTAAPTRGRHVDQGAGTIIDMQPNHLPNPFIRGQHRA